MRFQGKITDWKDDKGFGFVMPNGGGPRVFVHIKSFSKRHRRPTGSELVTYELASDARGRPQGLNIMFVGDRARLPQAVKPGPGFAAFSFATLFLLFVTLMVAAGKSSPLVLLVYLIASVVAYLAYVLDKAAAVSDRWRTSENALHLLGLVGGWPGAMFAQRTLRHKTQKRSFQVTYWVTVLLNCAALALLLSSHAIRPLLSLFGFA